MYSGVKREQRPLANPKKFSSFNKNAMGLKTRTGVFTKMDNIFADRVQNNLILKNGILSNQYPEIQNRAKAKAM